VHDAVAAIKTELKTEGPADLAQHIATAVAFVQPGGTDSQHWRTAAGLDRLMNAMVRVVKAEVDRLD